MDIDIELQEPIYYNEALRTIIIIVIILFTLFIIGRYIYIKKYGKILKFLKKRNQKSIKETYISKINDLHQKYKNKQIDTRKTSIKLSYIIRQFVYSVTDIEVLKFVLEDIQKLNIPELYDLIVKLYSPEFSKYSENDIDHIFEQSKLIISNWKL